MNVFQNELDVISPGEDISIEMYYILQDLSNQGYTHVVNQYCMSTMSIEHLMNQVDDQARHEYESSLEGE